MAKTAPARRTRRFHSVWTASAEIHGDAMAPVKTYNAGMTTKEKTKLRKPVVEKMRRDRINGSIQQLKALLEKELKESQLTSKLEKADILEMAVLYLRDNLRPAAPRHCYADGFAKCLQETLCFLSAHDRLPDSRRKLLDHFHPQERRADKYPAGPDAPCAPLHSCSAGGPDRLWRPW